MKMVTPKTNNTLSIIANKQELLIKSEGLSKTEIRFFEK